MELSLRFVHIIPLLHSYCSAVFKKFNFRPHLNANVTLQIFSARKAKFESVKPGRQNGLCRAAVTGGDQRRQKTYPGEAWRPNNTLAAPQKHLCRVEGNCEEGKGTTRFSIPLNFDHSQDERALFFDNRKSLYFIIIFTNIKMYGLWVPCLSLQTLYLRGVLS